MLVFSQFVEMQKLLADALQELQIEYLWLHGGTTNRDEVVAKFQSKSGPPVFLIPPGADLEKLRGGPDVTFEGLMPKPGLYRAWTQVRRGDKLHTIPVTFNVVPAP